MLRTLRSWVFVLATEGFSALPRLLSLVELSACNQTDSREDVKQDHTERKENR